MMVLALLAATLSVGSGTSSASAPSKPHRDRVTAPAELAALIARARVPSFTRQTKLACNACHNGFPQLTAFGRMFKLNGYTLTGLTSIVSQQDSAARSTLELPPIAPLSVMAIVSATQVSSAPPGTQSTTAQFPQELSLFASAAITSKMGIFSQFTYEDQSGTFAIDNVDVRFASHTQLNGRDLLYGVTLHNNPTVQDVWNTTPAWSYPFNSASVAPAPGASTLVEGALGQSVLGLGAYTLLNDALYAEVTGYVAAPQGTGLPLDANATDTPRALSPYWRVALQHQFPSTYLMVGTFGLSAAIYPSGVSGPTNRFTDVGIDAQVERKFGNAMLIGRGSYIHEDQTLSAFFSEQESQNVSNTLSSYKLNVSYLPDQTHALTLGYFGSSGTRDNVLYAPEAVTGSSTSSPGSQGETLEFSVSPWLNARLGVQYVMYQKFNGATRNYDVAVNGRSAKDNNTLYVYLWFAY